MRLVILSIVIAAFGLSPAFAEAKRLRLASAQATGGSASDKEMISELKTILERRTGPRRPLNASGEQLWKRWTHAVCIGCDPTPKGMRIVHTYPLRVLKGILSSADDDRERRGLGV